MNLQLQSRSVIVTGATKGIGKAIALTFASEGCKIGFCARNAAEVAAMQRQLEGLGIPCVGMALDVKDGAQVATFVGRCADSFGGIDSVISNVSAANNDWNEMFATDLMSAVYLFEAALPWLLKSEMASFTAISSRAAYTGGGAYAAMKCALMSYVKGISTQYAPRGIRANIVSPGDIYFEGGVWDRIKRTDPKEWEQAQERNRFGRLGTPQEIANAVVFLASPAASFISGANLRVDGAGSPTTQF